MKKVLFFLAAGLLTGSAVAQTLPQPSPSAKVEQTVGLTEIAITYSRPSVKGRDIFGDLVPYDVIWRTGANAPTMFTNSTDIMFGKQTLAPGTYALFTMPAKDGNWTVVLNSDTEQWGAGNYDKKKDLVTINTKVSTVEFTETFTIGFSDITNNSGSIVITWDKTKVVVPFTVNTKDQAKKNIEEAIAKGEELEKVYSRAASYYSKTLNNDEVALDFIKKGLAVKETHNLYFLQAQIVKKQGKTKEAIELATKAHELALAAKSQGWADYIQENIEAWEK